VREAVAQMAGGADAGETRADDHDVEVLAHGPRG
jgi:hypothetical protein